MSHIHIALPVFLMPQISHVHASRKRHECMDHCRNIGHLDLLEGLEKKSGKDVSVLVLNLAIWQADDLHY